MVEEYKAREGYIGMAGDEGAQEPAFRECLEIFPHPAERIETTALTQVPPPPSPNYGH